MSPELFLLLLYFLAGAVGAAIGSTISAAQTAVLGYENGTILLNVSYYTEEPLPWLQIRWDHVNKAGQLVICTVTNEAGKKTVKQFPPDGYEKRMTVIAENGSLSIRHLKKEDSGVYRVSLLDTDQTKTVEIHVTVNQSWTHGSIDAFTQNNKLPTEHPQNCSCSSSGVDVPTSAWVLFSSRLSTVLIALFVFFILHFRERRNQKRRMSYRRHKFC